MIARFTTKLLAAAGLFAALSFFATPAHAAYNSNNLIDDGRFTNYTTMDESAIQNFMNARNSGLKNYVDPSVGQSAARIIRDAAWDFGINPQVIMATLQKEQSLMTNPNPSASNINFAMGYGCPTTGSCSYPGFYQQIRNGSWQLRFNMHRASGNNGTWVGPTGQTWGNPAILYACRNATSYYSTGLFPGRTVTFYAHTNGQAYANVAIANAATAAMYCYTPHVYNPSGNPVYYSGSYNFVTFYEQWFGPTQGEPYAWAYAGQSSSVGSSMLATQKATWTVYAQNVGTATWSNTGANPVRIGTSNGRDRSSAFCDSSWLSCNRAATLNETSVAPGQTGSFTFVAQAPVPGQYSEYFNLLAEGIMWMNDPGLYFGIGVTAPSLTGTITGNTLPTAMIASATATGTLSIRNDGNATWYKTGRFPMNLGTSSPTDRSSKFQSPSWLGSTRASNMNEVSVAPGQTATFTVPLKAPVYNGAYTETFSRVVDGFAWTSQIISHSINVSGGQAPPANSLSLNQSLMPNQVIRSFDGRFLLILQSDGNLVLYSPRRAIWSSGTVGRNPGMVILQGDGNFVTYDSQGRAYWATWTQGNPGTSLVVQDDGNVVIYNAQGHPIWNTRTAGQL
jgi:hypothetical protein